MLNLLRKKKIMKRILWGLAIIIIPAFVLWGAGSLSKRKLPFKYVGKINNRKVTVDGFIKSIKDVQIGLFLNYFNRPDTLNKIQNDRKLLNRLAWENLLLKSEIKKGEIKIMDQEVVAFVTGHPLFTRGGVFDDTLYKYILKNSLGMTPRTFEESVRSFLMNSKKRTSIIENVTISDEEVLKSYKNEFEKAKIDYVIIDKKAFENDVFVLDDEIKDFYEKNKNLFQEPEKVILEYIEFPHEKNKEKALESLRIVYGKLSKHPGNMKKTAANLDIDVKETSPFSRYEIIQEIRDVKNINPAAFRLKPMVEILPIINENEDGISYIIRVKEKTPSRDKELAAVSEHIRGIIKNAKALELAKKRAIAIYDKAKSQNNSIKNIAKDNNLHLYKSDFITRYDYIEGAGESYQMIDEVFKLKSGEISKPVQIRKGFTIIEPLEFLMVDNKKFEAAKKDYSNKILTLKKMKALEDWFNKVRGNSSLNVDLDKI